MRLTNVAAAAAVILAVTAGSAGAAANVDGSQCLQATNARGLTTRSILQGLGLPRDQAREVEALLSTFNSGHFPGLDGLGLTAEQTAVIQRRIDAQVAAMNAHPVGWPCFPFLHVSAVEKFVRSTLVYNGFRPAMTFRIAAPRQITFQAFQDGIPYSGVVVKTDRRRIFVSVRPAQGLGGSTAKAFVVPFDV